MQRFFGIMLLLLAFVVLPAWPGLCASAQGPAGGLLQSVLPRASAEADKDKAAPAAPVFPGLAEVAPAAADLARKAVDAYEVVARSWKISALKAQADQIEERLHKLRDLVSKIGNLGSVDFNKVTDANVLAQKEKKELESMVATTSANLAELDAIRGDWEKRRSYWQEWKTILSHAQAELPQETFAKAHETIESTLDATNSATNYLVSFQERVSQLLQETISQLKPIEMALEKQRSNTLKKVEPSLFSRRFIGQFDATLWPALRASFLELWTSESLLDALSGWLLAARVGGLLLSLVVAFQLRAAFRAAEEWAPLLRHPLVLGVFISQIFSLLFAPEYTGIWRYLAWLAFVISVSVLIANVLPHSQERKAIFFLAVFFTVTCVFRLLSLPMPLYRLFSFAFTLSGAVFFFALARMRARRGAPRGFLVAAALSGGGVAMSVAALAQAAGVVNVADRLVFDLVAMVFLGLGAFLCCRLAACMVEVLLEQTPLARLDFVRRFGAELAVRGRKVLSIVIWGFTFVTVLRLLGLYGSTGQAAEQLFQWHYTVGKLTLSPSLLVLALFLLYLANSISWFMRSLLEAEVYPRKQMDSGAAHAMSKLLNYSIMLLGFLLAMSVLGLEMQNIAVLGGALSIGVGFGLQNIVNNFISGLILLFERPIKVGDRVVVDNEMGVVKRIGLRSTIIETADYSELIVPNSQFISQKVTNMTLSSTMARLLIPVGAAYGSDIGRVLELLREIGAANTRVATEPPPLSLLIKFGESSLDFELQVWLANITDMIHARSEICHEIARRFAHAGIEIPFPQRNVHLRQAPDVQAV